MENKDKPELTQSDLRNLSKLPEGKWFEEIDVWPAVKRTNYSLKRLVEAGCVEKTYSNQAMKYRKIKTDQ